MANEYPRSYRVADHIQRELSVIIRSELKDPRISPMLTISSVDVSRDLSVAKIYYTVLDKEEREDTQVGLERSMGFMRRQLSRTLTMRSVPQLRFHYDDSIEHGNRMSALIEKAVGTSTTVADETSDPIDSGSVDASSDVQGGGSGSDISGSDISGSDISGPDISGSDNPASDNS